MASAEALEVHLHSKSDPNKPDASLSSNSRPLLRFIDFCKSRRLNSVKHSCGIDIVIFTPFLLKTQL